MPPLLPIDLANFPALQTRKALLVLDLQNDFLAPDGTLRVDSPDGYVDRILAVAKAFRDARAGDIFWIRSQFDAHRPTADAHIVTSATPRFASSAASGSSHHGGRRGRRHGSEPPPDNQDADPEAFLSLPGGSDSARARDRATPDGGGDGGDGDDAGPKAPRHALCPGSSGCELAPAAAAAVDSRHDLVLAKSYYSAFEATQLLMRLRTRFVTELYLCGALTNISIYATALDAARHGLALTVLDDCCGYRDPLRHTAALTGLIQLTGCDTMTADDVLASLAVPPPPVSTSSSAPPPPPSQSHAHPSPSARPAFPNDFAAAIAAITATSTGPPRARRPKQAAGGGVGRDGSAGGAGPGAGPVAGAGAGAGVGAGARPDTGPSGGLPVRTKPPEPASGPRSAALPVLSGPVPSTSEHAVLSRSSPTAQVLPEAVPAAEPLQPVVAGAVAEPRSHSASNNTKPTGAAGSAGAGTASRQQQQQQQQQQQPPPPPPQPLPSSPLLAIDPAPIEAAGSGDDSDPLPVPVLMPKRRDSSRREAKAVAPAQKTLASPPHPAAVSAHAGAPKMPETTKLGSVIPSPVPAAKSDADSNGADSESGDATVAVDTTKEPAATEPICAGDTVIFHGVLPPSLEDGVYERLKDEVCWTRMSHQGGEVPRLVSVQGEVAADGSMPVYRHPADESPPLAPFTPTVQALRRRVEAVAGHPLNHVLIQLYRTGNDYISEHSDKTLDIVAGSYVCNLSLGAERTMVFRTKRESTADKDKSPVPVPAQSPDKSPAKAPRPSCRVQLPHNSLCRMGLQTNMRWLHAIRADKRLDRDKTAAELAFGGERISLTFRQIGTFLDRDQTVIWGQGAVGKTRAAARPVVNGQAESAEAVRMLRAFGTENHSADFDWAAHYGTGFDVLHMSSAPRFFAGADAVVNMTVQLQLAELGIAYAKGSLSADKVLSEAEAGAGAGAGAAVSSLELPIRYADNDRDRSTVDGVLGILLYLDAVYGGGGSGSGGATTGKQTSQHNGVTASQFSRLQQALLLQDKWRRVAASVKAAACSGEGGPVSAALPSLKALKSELLSWDRCLAPQRAAAESTAEEGRFVGGGRDPSVADFAFWPVLFSMEQALGDAAALEAELKRLGAGSLARWYIGFKARESVERVWK